MPGGGSDCFKARVFNQGFRYLYTLIRLVILKYSSQYPWQGQGRTVQGMGQLVHFTALFAEAAFQAVRLERFEVGDRAHFKPALLGSRKNLKVVSQS